jgi:hypothetical protein
MARRTTRKIDFNDEDAVLAEMARELDIDPDELEIDDSGRGLSSFGEGTIYLVSIRGGHKEWCVAEDVDTAYKVAVAVTTQDLEQEPEIFSKDFIESHIDKMKLARELEPDVRSGHENYVRDMDADDFWKAAGRENIALPEEDEEGELPDPDDDDIDKLVDAMTEESLRDPMAYLEDIYGGAEAVEQAIKIAGIDVAAAADDAVDTDGWQHFLASYDGNSHETPSGLVYWRAN